MRAGELLCPERGTIRTARLVLRPPRRSDLGPIVGLANDATLAHDAGSLPHPYSLQDGHALLHRQRHADRVWSICRQEGTVVGLIQLRPGLSRDADVAVWIGRTHAGHGFGTEAARAVIGHAFRRLGLIRLLAVNLDHSLAGTAALRRLEF